MSVIPKLLRRKGVQKFYGLSEYDLETLEERGVIIPFRKDGKLPNGKPNPRPRAKKMYVTDQLERMIAGGKTA